MRAALVSPVTTDGTLATVSGISHAPMASVITTRSEKIHSQNTKSFQWICLKPDLVQSENGQTLKITVCKRKDLLFFYDKVSKHLSGSVLNGFI